MNYAIAIKNLDNPYSPWEINREGQHGALVLRYRVRDLRKVVGLD